MAATLTIPAPIITYAISVAITKINGMAPTPNMDILGANITIEGTANAIRTTIRRQPNGEDEETEEDVTHLLKVFIKFSSSATAKLATSSDFWKTWSLTEPVPTGNANADGRLLITAMAQYLQTQENATTTVTVQVDNQPPVLTILRPLANETIVLTGQSVSVPLEVTARDNSQVTEVKWSLDNMAYTVMTLDQAGRGNAQVHITDSRTHTIKVLAKDRFNNTKEESVTIDVVPPFMPVDPADLTGPISYLGDLLEFAAKRIQVSATTPPSSAEATLPSATDFTNIFCQRFAALINAQNHAVALQSGHQIRISVDVLRTYLLKRVPQWQNRLQELDAAEADYRQQTYDALLRYLGTSDRELRRALTGDAAARMALANGLGIGTEALQGLLLSSAQVTEENLERIFGLADTHVMRDPFASNATPPELLVKRRAYLRSTWRQQDDAVRHPTFEIPVPVIEPDLVQADDLHSSTAISLWQARQLLVHNMLQALRDSRRQSAQI